MPLSRRPKPWIFPPPKGRLTAEKLLFAHGRKVVVAGVTFELEPGTVLGVIGPSGTGKSTLARLLTGVWRPQNGILRLDGADMHQWDQNKLGRHIGYLPQDVELFTGSVALNIGRFQEEDQAAVQAAAEFAGIHDYIAGLPDGYATVLEEQGRNLPGGLRQRIGLARALFASPRLVILDEPDANLDFTGLEALKRIVEELKGQGVTVVLITHRSSLLGLTDKLLLLVNGQQAAYGPTAEVLQKISSGAVSATGPAPAPAASALPGPPPPPLQPAPVTVQ